MNAVEVVFGDAAGAILEFSADSTDAVFEVESKVNQMATVTGALLTNFGYSADDAAEATIGLTERAADMASVFNTDVETAMIAINSALRGETEPIRQFGVNVDEATTKMKALELGLWDGEGALDQNAKTAARMAVIMEQTAKVQGDAANTADSFANRQRAMNEQMEKAKVAIGEALLPAIEAVLPVLQDMIPLLVGIADAVELIVNPIEKLSEAGDKLTESIEDTVDEIVREREELLAANDARDDAQQSIDEARLAMQDQERVAQDMVQAQIDSAAAHLEASEAAGDVEDATDDLEDSYADAVQRARDLRQAEQELAESRSDAVADVFDLIDAERELADAQAEVTRLEAEGKTGTEEYTDAVIAAIEKQGAYNETLAELNTADGIAALQELGTEAGLTHDDFGPLLDTLLRLRDMEFPSKTLSYVFETTGQVPANVAEVVDLGHVALLAEGGPLRAGEPAIVGEEGPELFVPDMAGYVHPNGDQPMRRSVDHTEQAANALKHAMLVASRAIDEPTVPVVDRLVPAMNVLAKQADELRPIVVHGARAIRKAEDAFDGLRPVVVDTARSVDGLSDVFAHASRAADAAAWSFAGLSDATGRMGVAAESAGNTIIHVAGSVLAERDLQRMIAEEQARARRRGQR